MKKLISFISIIALAMVSPFILSGVSLSRQDKVAEAQNVDALSSISLTEENILTQDLTVSSGVVTLGTTTNPFTGVFDGNGKVITIKGAEYYTETDIIPEGSKVGDVKEEKNIIPQSAYQGIFGYAEGATFRNIKIVCEDLFLDFDFSEGVGDKISEYFAGVLLGYGKDVTIENCEIEGTIFSSSENIESKITFGGLAGVLEGTSKVKNSGSYVDIDFDFDLTNIYTNRIGGMVGQLLDSSSMTFCVGYNSIKTTNISDAVDMVSYQGGMVGNVNGSLVTIFNTVVTSKITTTARIDDTNYNGAIIGGITKLNSGNIASCGYYAETNGTESTNFFGNSGVYTYNFKDNTEKDNIIKIKPAYMMAEAFFDKKGNYDGCGLDWYGLLENWNFDSIWIIANDQAKLQQFQHFEVKLVSKLGNDTPLDDRYNTLIDETDYTGKDDDYSYGEKAEFKIGFASVEQYQGFYEISDILKDGKSIGYEQFGEPTTEPKEGEKEVTKRTSSNGNYEFWTYYDPTNNVTNFVFKVKVEYSTRGTFAFRTREIPYFAYVLAEEGGEVKSASSTVSRPALEPRQLTKNYEWNIKAVPAYKYAFAGWTLWEEITEELYESNKETTEDYFKYTYKDPATGDDVSSFWHLIQSSLADMEEVLEAMKKEDFTITFGTRPFTENFMLKATFIENTYSFNIKDLDIERVAKVEIVNSLGENFVFNKDTSNADFVTLDQREKISMNVFVRPGYTLDPATLPEKLNAEYLGKSEVDFEGERCEVHKFSISTKNFKEFANDKEQVSFEVAPEVKDEGVAGGLPLWVFIAIGGGALLLIIIVIVIIVKVKRGGGGGGKKQKAGKKAAKATDYDYNQMFR